MYVWYTQHIGSLYVQSTRNPKPALLLGSGDIDQPIVGFSGFGASQTLTPGCAQDAAGWINNTPFGARVVKALSRGRSNYEHEGAGSSLASHLLGLRHAASLDLGALAGISFTC